MTSNISGSVMDPLCPVISHWGQRSASTAVPTYCLSNKGNILHVPASGLETTMHAAAPLPSRGLTVRIWRPLSGHRHSTSSAMTGGRCSVLSMRPRRLLRLRLCCENRRR